MSEEFEDVSVDVVAPVAETAAPVVAAEAPVVEAVVESVADSGSVPVAEYQSGGASVDESALQDSSESEKTYESYARRQIAQENGHTIDASDHGRAALTEAGRQAREASSEEKKAEFHAQIQEQMEERVRARQEFLEREHDFGGMKMSGHDLEKIIQFYANNPQMQDKLRDKMVKSGKTPAQAEKALKDFDEYMKILKKESEGQKLTEAEKRRKEELEKKEDVRYLAQQVAQMEKDNGIVFKMNGSKEVLVAKSSEIKEQRNESLDTLVSQDSSSQAKKNDNIAKLGELDNFSKTYFSTAPDLKDKFTASASNAVASNIIKPDFGDDVAVSVAAQAKAKPVMSVDTSFG